PNLARDSVLRHDLDLSVRALHDHVDIPRDALDQILNLGLRKPGPAFGDRVIGFRDLDDIPPLQFHIPAAITRVKKLSQAHSPWFVPSFSVLGWPVDHQMIQIWKGQT